MPEPVVGRASPFKARGPFRGIRAPFRGIDVWGRYPARTNRIRNSTMVGVVAGTPGTLPTNWSNALNGMTRTIVGTGVDTATGFVYVDFRYAGTAAATTDAWIGFDSTTGIASGPNQRWAISTYVALVGGSFANVTNARMRMDEYGAGASYLATRTGAFGGITAIDSAMRRRAATVTTQNAAIVTFQPSIAFTLSSGQAIDFTVRIAAPQVELGASATAPIQTSGSAASRVADVLAGAY